MSEESAPVQGDAGATTDSHANSSSEYVCRECGKEYNSRKGLTRHYRVDTTPCDGLECPTCGRMFVDRRGVETHHSEVHNEVISGVLIECDYCGGEVRKPECRVKRTDKSFCDKQCHAAYMRENDVVAGENNPYYVEPVELECDNCGEGMERPPSHVYDNNFCSRSCYNKYKIETGNFAGENHPRWKGGHVGSYGPNWYRQRRKARNRDQYRCQECRRDERDLGKIPSCHHKVKMRYFKDNFDAPEWYEKGNRMENLVLLCPEHHGKWEDMPVHPQFF